MKILSKVALVHCWFILSLLFSAEAISKENGKEHNDKVIINGDSYFPPYEFINSSGNPDGFNIDIIKAVMADLDLDYEIQLRSHTQNAVANKSRDTDIITGMVKFNNKSHNFLFRNPQVRLNYKIITRNGSAINTLSDLMDKDIIVSQGDPIREFLREEGFKGRVVLVDNVREALLSLSSGNYDAVICDHNAALYVIGHEKLTNFDVKLPTIVSYDMCIAVSKDHEVVFHKINDSMKHLKASGVYEKIYVKWFGHNDSIALSSTVWIVICIVLVIMVMSIVFVYILKRKVKIVTRKLAEAHNKESISLKKINTILSEIPIGIAIYDKDGKQEYINNRVGDIFGIPDIEVHRAKHISIYDDPSLSDEVKEKLRAGEDVDTLIEYSLEKATKSQYFDTLNSQPVYIAGKACHIRDDSGEVSNLVLIMNDVSIMHNQNLLLEDFKQKLSIAIDAGGLYVWEYDIKKDFLSTVYGNTTSLIGISIDAYKATIHSTDSIIFTEKMKRLIKGESTRESCLIRLWNDITFEYEYTQKEMSVLCSSSGIVEKIIGTNRCVNAEYIYQKEMSSMTQSLRLALEATTLEIWNFNVENQQFYLLKDGKFEKVNITFGKLLCLIHPDDTEDFHALLSSLVEGERDNGNIIYRIKSRAGGHIYIECNINVTHDKTGRVISLIASCLNVTERQNNIISQNNIINSLNMAMDAGHIVAWSYDIKSRTHKILYGDNVDDGVYTAQLIIHPDDVEKYNNYINELIAGDTSYKSIVIRAKINEDSPYCHFEMSIKVIYGINNEPVSLIGIRKDLSDIYFWQEKLKFTRELLKAVYDNLPIGFIFFDKEGIMKDINDVALNIFKNLGKEELIGKINMYKFQSVSDDTKEGLRKGINQQFILEYSQPIEQILDSKLNEDPKCFLDVYISVIHNNDGDIDGYLTICSDITGIVSEKKRIERLKIQYKTMFNSLLSGIEIRDINGNIIEVNDAHLNIFGIDNKEDFLKGNRDLDACDYIPPHIKNAIKHNVNSSFVEKLDFANVMANNYFKTSKKGVIFIDIRIAPMISETGELLGTVVLLTDVTKDRIYQKKLEEERVKINLAVKGSKVMIWEYDCSKKVFSVFNEDHLLTSNNIILEDYINYTHPDDMEHISNACDMMRRGDNDSFRIDMRYKTPSLNDWHYGAVVGEPFEYDENGKCIKYLGYRKDNTRIIQLNQELRDSAERIDYILDQSNIDTWDFDIKSRILKIYPCNKSHKRWTYKVEDYILSLPAEEQPKISKLLEDMMFYHIPNFKETICKMVDGKMVYLLINGIRIKDENGDVIRYSGLRRDITELMETQKHLEIEKERALEADKLKSKFLANMSHEIRTPLNAIVGFSELLSSAETAEEHEAFTNIISVNNELLLRLIDDILDLSKIESGMIELKPEIFNLSEICDEVYLMFKQKIASPEISFLVDNPYDSCIVNLDRNRLKQVGINFITNAIKYTVKGTIQMGYEYINKGVKIYVKDTGIGISKENYGKIFKRFEKFDTFAQGTGLGLSICKAIAEVQGGKVGFESEIGEGSYFWAWFPCEARINERKKE